MIEYKETYYGQLDMTVVSLCKELVKRILFKKDNREHSLINVKLYVYKTPDQFGHDAVLCIHPSKEKRIKDKNYFCAKLKRDKPKEEMPQQDNTGHNVNSIDEDW